MLQNLTLPKTGQGQPKVIIRTNYDGLESLVVHTKFRQNCSTDCIEKISKGIIPYTDMAAILVMWPASFLSIFISIYTVPKSLHKTFG